MDKNKYGLLGQVNTPEDLKKLDSKKIEPLCSEIRECIVDTVMENGGHLASNLGAVELSVAIHRVFDSPRDHIIFDVGHQSYAHKLLTGRFESFDSLRKAGGISGFTNRFESEYDCFGAGHSSTSISAGLGFAEADRLSGSDAYTVVVLGDGAFTGGMIHEALNNCDKNLRLVIILNENEMSISKNIGRFAASISKLRKKSGYFRLKRAAASFIKKIPLVGKGLFSFAVKVKKSLKNAMYGSNYFENMGLFYLGPVDGNNYSDVESLLTMAKNAGESVLVHLKTKKGKGYAPAEENPGKYHGVAPADKLAPITTFSDEMGKALANRAENDEKICAITAAMSYGTGLEGFREKFPQRFFDVGIAEEHAVTFAAGLSASGYKPVFAVYSTFLQRSYDQMIHDVALQRLPVIFCIDRAGFNAADGATHHGIFDVAFISQINGFKIYTPVTYKGLELSLDRALTDNCPVAIRYPSGCECEDIKNAFYKNGECDDISIRCLFPEDKAPDYVIITHGRITRECLKAKAELEKRNIGVGVMLCEYLAPYDELADEILSKISNISPKAMIFVEEEIRVGGFGENTIAAIKRKTGRIDAAYDIIAAEDPFVRRNEGQSYESAAGIDCDAIVERIVALDA